MKNLFHQNHHGPGSQQGLKVQGGGGGKTGVADEMDGALGLGLPLETLELEWPMAVIACTPLQTLAERYLKMMPVCFSAAAGNGDGEHG